MSRKSKKWLRRMAATGGSAEVALKPSVIPGGIAVEDASPQVPVPAPVPGPAPLGLAHGPRAWLQKDWFEKDWFQKDWVLVLLFFAATLLVYSHALNGAFIWDDDVYISQNPDLRSLQGLWRVWFQPWSGTHQYYPLSTTCFWLEWQLWGAHVLGYHLVNIFLHATASVLLWRILKRLKVPGALLAGALFALHPVNVMSVAWMNEMKNTLSGSLALGAIWAYLRFEQLGDYAVEGGLPEGRQRPWRWYALMLVLFQFAMLAKTAVSFLPVSLLLILWWQRGRVGRRELLPLVPMVAVVALMGITTIIIEHSTSGATGKDFSVSFPERLIVSGHSFFFYLGKLLLPVNLSFVYIRWQINVWDWRQYFWPLAAAAVLVGLWRLRGVIGRGPWAAAMHFYISTSFLVFMVVLYRMRYSFVSDHWEYFGSMSVFALMGAGLAKVLEGLGGWSNLLARRSAIGLFLLLGAMSWHQCGMYKDLDTLWKWTIARNPACWMAENNLGNDYLQDGRVDESIGHFQRAIELKQDYVLAMNNLGNAFMEKHRVDEAIVQYKNALAVKPEEPDTLNNLGYAYQQKGRVVEAIVLYQKAVEIKPDYGVVLNNLANALFEEGRPREAISFYQKAIVCMPDYAPALNNLAYLLATSRDPGLRNGAQALQLAQKAVHLTGGANALMLDAMAAAYAEQGRYSEAVAADWQAIARALAVGNTRQAALFQKHISLYQAGQPLRDK